MKLPPRPRSPLTIVVLELICEEPLHPYRMQTLITQRGKGEIANVTQRNSVYQTIDSLCRAGLIAIQKTSQDSRRPERTIYEATAHGRLTLRSWIRTGLSTVAREFPEFPAVLATLYGVDGPADLAFLLGARVEVLKVRLPPLERPAPGVPRLFRLEGEYIAAMIRAECKWLRGVIAELQSGHLAFPTKAEMLQMGPDMGGPSAEAIHKYAKEFRASFLSDEPKRRRTKKTRNPPRAPQAAARKANPSRSR
jgi:DNA-binding PadR family transcriptional regulator